MTLNWHASNNIHISQTFLRACDSEWSPKFYEGITARGGLRAGLRLMEILLTIAPSLEQFEAVELLNERAESGKYNDGKPKLLRPVCSELCGMRLIG